MTLMWLYRIYTGIAILSIAVSVFNFVRARTLWRATRTKASLFCQGVAILTFIIAAASTIVCSEAAFLLPPLTTIAGPLVDGMILVTASIVALVQMLILTVSPRWLGK